MRETVCRKCLLGVGCPRWSPRRVITLLRSMVLRSYDAICKSCISSVGGASDHMVCTIEPIYKLVILNIIIDFPIVKMCFTHCRQEKVTLACFVLSGLKAYPSNYGISKALVASRIEEAMRSSSISYWHLQCWLVERHELAIHHEIRIGTLQLLLLQFRRYIIKEAYSSSTMACAGKGDCCVATAVVGFFPYAGFARHDVSK